MEETKPKIEWFEFKGAHVAMKGEQIICIVQQMEDFPCEAYVINPQGGVYSTLKAAKREAEAGNAMFEKCQAKAEEPPQNFYLDILKQIVAALETKAKPVE